MKLTERIEGAIVPTMCKYLGGWEMGLKIELIEAITKLFEEEKENMYLRANLVDMPETAETIWKMGFMAGRSAAAASIRSNTEI